MWGICINYPIGGKIEQFAAYASVDFKRPPGRKDLHKLFDALLDDINAQLNNPTGDKIPEAMKWMCE